MSTFGYLAFHTPFGGMVKGAHRNLMRKIAKARPAAIEEDFQRRMHPGLTYCQRVGNVMGATTMLSLASTIDNADFSSAPAHRRLLLRLRLLLRVLQRCVPPREPGPHPRPRDGEAPRFAATS